jgi:signal transduction histidine kinase
MRVLIVDDDPVQRQMAQVALRMGGHAVTAAENGAAGLQRLQTERFDVAMLDHEMPGMSGLEVLLALRERAILPTMPVVYVTSRDDAAVIDRAFELGASAFVVKPVNWSLMQHELRFVVRAAANERAAGEARDEAVRLAETKEQLLSITRHELRTPLNAVIGFGRVLRDGLPSDHPLREHADEMLAAAERLNSRVSDMMTCLDLTTGRIAAERSPEDVGALIDAHLATWRRSATARHIDVTVENAAPAARILVDPRHLTGILSRLVDNAVAHGRTATEIRISIKPEGQDQIAIAVADDGEGIPPARLEHCQTIFAQGDMSFGREGEGLGLGLYIARGLAELNGLRFSLASGGSQAGTVATLRGPAVAAPT